VLNPAELVCRTSNGRWLAKRNLAQLTGLVRTRLRRMQYWPGLLDRFLAGTRLDLGAG
jgi:hypothetical protein